jgi:hypothetical protein
MIGAVPTTLTLELPNRIFYTPVRRIRQLFFNWKK